MFGQHPTAFAVLPPLVSLGIGFRPDLQGITIGNFVYGHLPQLIPNPLAGVAQEDPRLRFDQPAR